AAALFVLLVSGTAISTYFAFQANDQKKEAQTNLYVAHMNLAQVHWENANMSHVIELLDLYRSPSTRSNGLRGWEWYYQDRLCHPELRTLNGHTFGPTRRVLFSPDGTRLALASGSSTVKIWDIASGQEVQTLKGHTDGGVSFSPDGRRLASAGGDGTVK